MKFDREWLKRRWVDYTIAACIAVAFYLFLSNISVFFGGFRRLAAFMKPVLIGIVISYVLNPLAGLFDHLLSKKLTRKREIHTLSIIGAVVAVLLVLALLMVALIPQLVGSIMTLVTNLNSYISSFQNFIQSVAGETAEENAVIASLLNTGDSLLLLLEEKMPSAVNNVVSTAGSIGMNVFNSVISFIMAIYFLADKDRLLGGVSHLLRLLLPEREYRRSADFWGHCHRILIRYIGGDLLDGLIVGMANFIFMKVMGMPYAVLVSVFVGVTNLAPTFGPLAGAVIGGFILILINPWHALWFIIFTIVLQTVDGYVIKPKLFGGTLGVSSVWILVCIIVGGRMLGVWGILLSIPFAAISDYIYKRMIIQRLEVSRGIRNEEDSDPEGNAGNGSRNPEAADGIEETAETDKEETADADRTEKADKADKEKPADRADGDFRPAEGDGEIGVAEVMKEAGEKMVRSVRRQWDRIKDQAEKIRKGEK